MALITVMAHGVPELSYLMGILPAEMTGEQVHLQLPPLFKAQLLVFTQGDQKARFVTGDHPLAHEYHHLITGSFFHFTSTIFFLNNLSFSVWPDGA
jgi:hypothetical protein